MKLNAPPENVKTTVLPVNVSVGQSAEHVVAPSSSGFSQFVAVDPVNRHMPAKGLTVNGVALTADCPPTVTVIIPEVAPAGTVAVMLVPELAVTTAVMPLNFTSFASGVPLKLTPVNVTELATGPELGVKAIMEGIGAGSDLVQDRIRDEPKSTRRSGEDFIRQEGE